MMPFNRGNLAILLVVVVVLFVLGRAVRIMREYQRAVMFTLGRFSGVKVIGGLVDR
jgi:regulator of protease activity HflC (stomatin/prohibitin superfamily)